MAEEHYSISQISPKSDTLDNRLNNAVEYSTSTVVELESSRTVESLDDSQSSLGSGGKNVRVERSASPILNDVDPVLSSSFNERHLDHVDHNEVFRDKSGRYFESIQPTSAFAITNDGESLRTAKGLDEEDHFLSKRGPLVSSGPQNNPNNATLTSQIAFPTNSSKTGSRQNNNPDIQDIITGIVKLLNGNVNVHANGQQGNNRRPSSNRINNRGPPRISESQPIPLDDNNGSTNRPSVPYPFDRPDGPIRPFLTGVPIPEQIVPSMQQNYRPGFVSQNRLPWQRPRPNRPPSRRPLPPYKPIPLPEYKPEEDTTLHSSETAFAQNISITNSSENEDDDSQFDIVVTEDEDVSTDLNDTTSTTENIPDSNEDENNESVSSSSIAPTNTVTTIIQTTSEVNLAHHSSTQNMSSHEVASTHVTSSSEIEPSFTDSVQTTSAQLSSVTPILETVIHTNLTSSSEEIPSVTKSVVQSSLPPQIISTPPNVGGKSSSMVLHPRPGIVLDDPDFKPGGQVRPRPHQNRIPIQATRPPGYGEIFDITLSAIQGPGGGGTKQTVNLNQFGQAQIAATNVDEADIIISPSGDQGSVFIDGKRTYISLFGEETDKVENIVPSKTTVPPLVRATSTNKLSGVTGSGYAVAETESPVSKVSSYGHHHRPHHRPRVPQQPPVR